MKNFIIQKLLFPLVRVYWRVCRPRTYGVKAVLARDMDGAILMVRHTYGDSAVWNLPGGGYNPRKETAAAAVAREVREELSLEIGVPVELGQYRTDAQGKRDTVTLFECTPASETIQRSAEIAEAAWFPPGSLPDPASLYAVTQRGLELHRESIAGQGGADV